MADALEIVARFTADTADLVAGSEKAKKSLGGVGDASGLMGGAVLAGAGVAIGALAAMTIAASDDAAEQAKLEQAITAAGAATATSTDEVNKAIAASQARAFSDTDARDALTSLVTATGSVTEATALLATAQDIARFAGVDLATAADAVAKAAAGQDGALTKLIPGLQKGATATDTIANAQKAAAGQADLYAASTEGQLATVSDSFGELSESIGAAFLPILKEATGALVGVAKVLSDNSGLVSALAVVVGVLAAGIIAANVAIKAFEAIQLAVKIATTAWTAAQWLLNVALSANPIGLVVVAIVALVAILAIVWQNSEDFRNAVTRLGAAIAQNLQPVLKAITATLGGVGDAIGGVVGWLKSLVDWVGNAIGAVGRFLDSINPLKNFQLPALPFSLAVPAPALAAGTRGAGRAARAGSTTITINTGADPEAVVRALRRWAGNNGGSGTFLRGLDRAAS